MARESKSSAIVTIGDLNGALDALVEILRGTGLIDRRGRWSGGTTHLVQMGDIFNRGDGARGIFELLVKLRTQARDAGGDVTILLGNHEVMTALGNEAYCTLGEYLAFASRAERAAWPRRVQREFLRLYREFPSGGPIAPALPRLEVWMSENVPGRDAMRRALGRTGRLGKLLRRLPVARILEDTLFIHAGLTPAWARHGVDGLNELLSRAWAEAPEFWGDLSKRSILRSATGPLLTRRVALGRGPEIEKMLSEVLEQIGARRMVIGHTMTHHAPGGKAGRITTRFRGRLVYTDVGIRAGEGAPRAALILEGGGGREWRPGGETELW